MKWSSSSSSLSSSGDRRSSVFYTEPESYAISNTDEMTSNGFPSLESAILISSTRPISSNSKLLSNGITKKSFKKGINNDYETITEKEKEPDQLTCIIKTLLYLESRLKNDQKMIRQMLYEKDEIINRQWNEITCIKNKYNDQTVISTEIDEIAQFCPQCRKNYYMIERKQCGVQTTDDFHFRERKISPSQSVEFASSSEEPESQQIFSSNTFASARRSKKYMSKRTTGTFREYLKSKQAVETETQDTTENVESATCENNDEVVKQTENSYSSKINSLHGIKHQNFNDYESMTNYDYSKSDENNENHFKNKSDTENKFEDAFGVNENNDFETTDDWYASASDVDDSDNSLRKPYGYNAVNPVLECVNQILLQQSMDGLLDTNIPNVTNEVLQKHQTLPRTKRVHFSTQNSMVQVPRNKSPPPPPPTSNAPVPNIQKNNNNGSTTITNTISEQPIKSKIEQKHSYDIQSIYSNEYEPIGGSEHNSSNYYIDMESKFGSEEAPRPINKIERSNTPPDLPPKPPNLMKFKKLTKFLVTPQLNKLNQTTSNSSNLSEPDYCSISEINEMVSTIHTVEAEVHNSLNDYSSTCGDSNSVINDKNVIITLNETNVEQINKEEDSIDDDIDSFSDIPKLPNVAEIVSPTKKDSLNRFINQDNYITKSPLKEYCDNEHLNNPLIQSQEILNDTNTVIVEKKNNFTKVLNEIHKQKPTVPPKIIKTSSTIVDNIENVNIIADKTPIQAEFDWYNLDAEYGKCNQPDIIRETDTNGSELFLKLFDNCSDTSSSNKNIEYNLDEEFNLVNQPDIVTNKLNNITLNNNFNTSNSKCINKSIENYFQLPVISKNSFKNNGETPKICRRNSESNYESFLKESGLSTKPIIPRRKRVYYSGPFI